MIIKDLQAYLSTLFRHASSLQYYVWYSYGYNFQYRGQTMIDKVRENKARRAAARQGFRLVKSRRRDARATDYGLYALLDANTNNLTRHRDGPNSIHSVTLEDAEHMLS